MNPLGNDRRGLRAVIATVALCALLRAGSAGAQVVVTDPAHMIRTIYGHYMKYSQDAIQYAKEIAQWKQTFDHYRQQLIQGNIYKGEAGQMPTFAKRGLDEGMAESCPTPRGTDAIAWQQLEVCRQIVRAQNAQYNKIVEVLETATRRDRELQQIYDDRQSVGTDQGRLAANDNQLASFQARVQMDVEYAQLVVSSYDSYIARLKGDQVRLAKEALTGKASIVGDIVRGAALKTALKAARHGDR